jgi:glyoxylase-like metal-dependent hydrolase (beta-lactamase superfamily II)
MTIRAVHHINCATMCPLGGPLVGASGFGRGRMVAHCLVLETERDGLILVDTGFGTRDCEDRTHMPAVFRAIVKPLLDPHETALAQIENLGFAPEDVKHIVVTHLDTDHAGGLPDFPRAQVHLHAREHAAAMARTSFVERQRYVPAHFSHGPSWQLYREDGDTWRGLPAVTRLRGIDADIGIVPMHGHTRGHSAVIVRTGDRWLVHAGDAYFHHAAMRDSGRVPAGVTIFETALQMDASARRASVAALRQLKATYTDLDIFCAHSETEYSAFRGAA